MAGMYKLRDEIFNLTLEEAKEKYHLTEEQYLAIKNSKSGWIIIQRLEPTRGRKHDGFTAFFGEGLSCYLSNPSEWYYTSIVTHIDWENNVFKTLNSLYSFKFTEDLCR